MATTRVHKNLNKGCWSITRAGRLVAHAAATTLTDARLVVQPGGLARVLKTGVRAVHAYAVGTEGDRFAPDTLPADAVEVTYNPFRAGHFTRRDNGERVDAAALLVFWSDGRMYAVEPK